MMRNTPYSQAMEFQIIYYIMMLNEQILHFSNFVNNIYIG